MVDASLLGSFVVRDDLHTFSVFRYCVVLICVFITCVRLKSEVFSVVSIASFCVQAHRNRLLSYENFGKRF